MSTVVEPGVRDVRTLLRPLPGPDGRTELRLAVRALAVLAALALPVVAVAAALHGAPGAWGALAGAGLVAVLFGGGGAVQALAARRAGSAMGIMLAGLGLRIAIYLVALQVLGGVAALHRPSLAVATLVAFVVTLHHELRVINRTPELFWVDAGNRSGASAPRTTR